LLDGVIATASAEGRTVVLASHELDHARGLSGRELALVGGQGSGVLAPAVSTAVAGA